jgi:antitoxin HicB
MKRRFSVVLAPQPEGGYTVTSPDILELVTEGDTRDEAFAMAKDCADALALTFLDRGDDAPDEGGAAEVETIEVDLDALRDQIAAERAAATA